MNIDKKSLEKLAQMDDGELKANILKIAGACGADTGKLERKLTDMNALKRSISSMSEKDLSRAMKLVGEKNSKIIAENLDKLNKKG